MDDTEHTPLTKEDRAAYKRAMTWLGNKGLQKFFAKDRWRNGRRVNGIVYGIRPYDKAMTPWITRAELAKAAALCAKLNAKTENPNKLEQGDDGGTESVRDMPYMGFDE